MLRNLIVLTFGIAFINSVVACSRGGGSGDSSGGSSSNTVVLSGTISSSSAPGGAFRPAGAVASADKVVGMQVSGLGVAGGAGDFVTADVEANNKFALSVDKGASGGAAVVMLLDTTRTRKIDQVLGFITLVDSAGTGSLISVPTGNAGDAVDLGVIASGVSNRSLQDMTAIVNSSLSAMRERGRVDAMLRNLKNNWANAGASITYSYMPGFEWGRSYRIAVNAVDWFDVSTYYYKGNQFYFRSNDPALLSAGVCTASADPTHVAVKLVPPRPFDGYKISYLGVTSSAETITAMHNDNAAPITALTCGASTGGIAGGFYFGREASGGYVNFNWGGGGVRSDDFPSGIWALQVGSEEKAFFDIKITSPADDAGHYKVYLPAVKVVTDDSGVIQRVDVLFYVWNGVAYEPITDPTLFLSQITLLGLTLTDYWTPTGTPVSNNMELVHVGNGVFRGTPSASFRSGLYDDGFNTDAASSLTVVYNLYGVGIRFDLRWF
jgi:hypothetical protein